ncbi:hypothetical protein [Algivirga pacifica]|uniref:Uncharacterized protein n=1 Tax=Algivirga pacifica TaxID=1162670 RepID=A0ABP9D4J1_9BACT
MASFQKTINLQSTYTQTIYDHPIELPAAPCPHCQHTQWNTREEFTPCEHLLFIHLEETGEFAYQTKRFKKQWSSWLEASSHPFFRFTEAFITPFFLSPVTLHEVNYLSMEDDSSVGIATFGFAQYPRGMKDEID